MTTTEKIISSEEALERFYMNFPIKRNLRVHDDFVYYSIPNESWAVEMLKSAKDTITSLELPLVAEVERFGFIYMLIVKMKK